MSDMTLFLAAFLGPLLAECAPDATKQLHCRSSASEKQKQSTEHEQTKITSLCLLLIMCTDHEQTLNYVYYLFTVSNMNTSPA